MNPAKAAPSAPVKKPPGKIRRSSRAVCLSYFFLLLAVGEAVQRHHNQHEKADDQQDTGHADEHHGQGGHPGRKMKSIKAPPLKAMQLPAELCKMQRKKRETDGFSKSTWMTPPGSHPTSGFGTRHGLPKFFRHKKRRIVQNDAAKTEVSSVDIPTGWDPRTKQQRRVALADFSAAPWRGFEKSERGPNSSSLFQPLAAVVAVALGWLLALPAAGPRYSNPSRSQSQRVTYAHAKEKQQR